jgi:hypothetical protein
MQTSTRVILPILNIDAKALPDRQPPPLFDEKAAAAYNQHLPKEEPAVESWGLPAHRSVGFAATRPAIRRQIAAMPMIDSTTTVAGSGTRAGSTDSLKAGEN